MALAGAGLGAACATGVVPLLAAVVGSVGRIDVVAFVAFPASLLIVAAVAATWLPARRAATTDPSVTLRAE